LDLSKDRIDGKSNNESVDLSIVETNAGHAEADNDNGPDARSDSAETAKMGTVGNNASSVRSLDLDQMQLEASLMLDHPGHGIKEYPGDEDNSLSINSGLRKEESASATGESMINRSPGQGGCFDWKQWSKLRDSSSNFSYQLDISSSDKDQQQDSFSKEEDKRRHRKQKSKRLMIVEDTIPEEDTKDASPKPKVIDRRAIFGRKSRRNFLQSSKSERNLIDQKKSRLELLEARNSERNLFSKKKKSKRNVFEEDNSSSTSIKLQDDGEDSQASLSWDAISSDSPKKQHQSKNSSKSKRIVGSDALHKSWSGLESAIVDGKQPFDWKSYAKEQERSYAFSLLLFTVLS
jgi:hypothetical protein